MQSRLFTTKILSNKKIIFIYISILSTSFKSVCHGQHSQHKSFSNPIFDGICHEESELYHAPLDINWVSSTMRSGWYIPLSSISYIYSYCYFLKGTKCESIKEMSSMCLRLRSDFSSMPFNLVHSGFGNIFSINCTVDNEVHECSGTDIGEKLSKHFVKVYITHTDNEEIAIAIKCQWKYGGVSHGRRAWSLMTKSPIVSEKTKKMVLEHIESFGFDPSKIIEMDYTKCSK